MQFVYGFIKYTVIFFDNSIFKVTLHYPHQMVYLLADMACKVVLFYYANFDIDVYILF